MTSNSTINLLKQIPIPKGIAVYLKMLKSLQIKLENECDQTKIRVEAHRKMTILRQLPILVTYS